RYEHIHVRFSQAIHGLRNFWEALPTKSRSETTGEWCGASVSPSMAPQIFGRFSPAGAIKWCVYRHVPESSA
ncbi:hypothetical protein, partial [Marinobacter persicus]|uniref:hypothetical protein n=1 Tax=Marinobacter persicus TaxID=930118 RepID=UPI001D10C24D